MSCPQIRSNDRSVQSLIFLCILAVLSSARCGAALISWTNTTGGNWNVATNWSPNQVPGSGDTVSISTPGTYTVTLNVDASVDSLVIGGAASGTQTLQGNSFGLQAGSAAIQTGGILALSNTRCAAALTVRAGGMLVSSSLTLDGQVTVQNGGQFLLQGSSTLGEGNLNSDTNYWLWVQSGGVLNASASSSLTLFAAMTNGGTVNLTNYGVNIYNNGTSAYNGGFWNQPGAVLNLIETAGIAGNYGYDYAVNDGTINIVAGSSTINITSLTNLGTVATLPGSGVLRVGTFNGLGSLAGTYNAAVGTAIQFVSGSSPGTSAGASLVLGGGGQYQFVSGLLTLPTEVIPGLVMAGGGLLLGPGFQGGAIRNLALNGINLTNSLPISGRLMMTNGVLVTTSLLTNGVELVLNNVAAYGAITVGPGGSLMAGNSTLDMQVNVENGGDFQLIGSVGIGQSNLSMDTNYWLRVEAGGVLNASASSTLTLFAAMTNAGTVNLTNYGVSIYNNGTSAYNGGLWNQAGAVLNLIDTAGISGTFGYDYLVNEGTINTIGGSSTINLTSLTNSGTIGTLPGSGVLRLGTFNGLGSLTGTYNAAAGTVIQFVSGYSPGTSAGAGLVLGGAGHYQFVSGVLTLPTDVIPGLVIAGGGLVLGPDFQGGAITNLALNGINLTNSLPISGSLTMTNGILVTTSLLTNGVELVLNNVAAYGAITIGSGGLLMAGNSTLDMQVNVQNGGDFQLIGSVSIGQGNFNADTNCWLWVQAGGVLNASASSTLTLFAAMTNGGTASLTNYGVNIYNNGTSAYNGGLWNQAGAVLNLIDTAGISGGFGYDYLVNEGTINTIGGNSTINVTSLTNSGMVATLPGSGVLRVGTFNGLGSLTGTYNAAAGTVIQFVSGYGPGTSAGAGLVMGGAGQYQFISGLLTLPTDVVPGLVMAGGGLMLGPGFQSGAITNLVLNGINLTNSLPISGSLLMTNGILVTTSLLTNGVELVLNNVAAYGAITIGSGGLLMAGNSTLDMQVNVENGGDFQLIGPVNIGQGNLSTDTNYWLWLQAGAVLNASASSTLTLFAAMTNAGTASLINYGVNIYNNGTSAYAGGLWNQPGAVLNLINTAGISGAFGYDYLVNEGTLNTIGGNSTINVTSLTNSGMVATLPGSGVLRVGTFNGPGSLTGTYNAAAGTVIQFVSGYSPGTSAGAGLVMGGAGQYQFISGLLTLPTDVVPGLVMAGGGLMLGPGFQGGTITNLVLNGIYLTNSLPISGSLLMTNGILVTTSLLTNGVELVLNNVAAYGAITIGSGGLLMAGNSTLDMQVNVENGGYFQLIGPVNIGQGNFNADANYWLWVQAGGVLNASASSTLALFAAMTNAGTVNLTNYGVSIYNNGTSAYNGGLWNEPGAVLNLIDTAGISGAFGSDYFVNLGAVNIWSPNGSSTINLDWFTNAGSLNALSGTLQLQSPHLLLQGLGTLNVGVASATQYGTIAFANQAPLAGSFGAILLNGFVPRTGTSMDVVNYSSFSGAFIDTNFQSLVSARVLPGFQKTIFWQATYTNTAMKITAVQTTEQFVFAATNGPPGGQYVVLATTNLNLPRSAWTPLATNTFDASGSFTFTNTGDAFVQPQEFFTYKYQHP